jgi:hypothetical protein
MYRLACIKEVIHESDHSIQNGLIGRFHFEIKCRYCLFVIKKQICAIRYFAGLVVVCRAFQILLAGICVIRIDYLDQPHQHFWIGQSIAITRIMFSRLHSLPEGLQH